LILSFETPYFKEIINYNKTTTESNDLEYKKIKKEYLKIIKFKINQTKLV